MLTKFKQKELMQTNNLSQFLSELRKKQIRSIGNALALPILKGQKVFSVLSFIYLLEALYMEGVAV